MYRIGFRFALVTLLSFAGISARSADNAWTNGAGNLTWNTSSANWTTPTVWNNANADSAVFGTTGAGTVTLQSAITARALRFNAAGYVVSGTGANTLTLSTAGSGALAAGEIQVNTATATIGATLAGSVGPTKTGTGTLILTGSNTFTGTMTVSAGILSIGNGGATGNLNPSALIPIVNNASLIYNRSNASTEGIAHSGTGTFTKTGAGTLTISSGSLTHTGGTTISAGSLILGSSFDVNSFENVANNGSLVFDAAGVARVYSGSISGSGSVIQRGTTISMTGNGTYTGGTTIESGTLALGNGGTTGSIIGNVLNNGNLSFSRTDAVTFDGVISGSGIVSKSRSNTLTLTAASTYTGLTSVSSGTLALTGSASVASSSSLVIAAGATLNGIGLTGGLNHDGTRFALASGQTLSGTGTVNGGLGLRAGSTLAAGVGSGTFTGTTNVTGNVDFQPGSTLTVRLNGLTDTDADRSRLLLSGAATFAGTAANPFTVNVSNGGAFPGTAPTLFTLVDASTVGSTGLDTPLSLTVGAGGTATATNGSNVRLFVSGFNLGDRFNLSRAGSDVVLQFTPVPEPIAVYAIIVVTFGTIRSVRRGRRTE